jgi:hypothetical protein
MPAKKKIKKAKFKLFDNSNDLIALSATVVVAVVFALLFIGNKTPQTQQTSPSAPVTEKRLILGQQNGTKESGTAILTESNGGLIVTLSMANEPPGVAQPAHIHMGSCPNPGAVVYNLQSVVNGKSITTLPNVKLADLDKKQPLSINVHKSAAQSGIYVSCGNYF